ncbi:MAG TPA: saccharopine dehydrogenase, partial [Burkholderiaceae bacterium]|nr:saccharopine dehydrogenase [Burkholderiaceae bacterium]
GPVNTRVVRRTAALLKARGDAAYGATFRYQEYLRFGRGPLAAAAAAGVTVGMGVGMAALRFKTGRALARAVAVSPGQGPTERSMDGGSFRCELVGKSASGKVVRGRVAGQGDPGNRATTKFVCESALALALQPQALPGGERGGGVLTPASGLGMVLGQRLIATGMTLEPVRS